MRREVGHCPSSVPGPTGKGPELLFSPDLLARHPAHPHALVSVGGMHGLPRPLASGWAG